MKTTAPTAQDRPLVTFALFAYNQEQYIREAVEGAFAQTYEPLEIILSDDCSSDRTFEIMEEMAAAYKGPHAIRINKNSCNIGIAAHFNVLVNLVKGQYLMIAAGDDVSLPHRTSTQVRLLEEENYSFVESGYQKIDEIGRLLFSYGDRSPRDLDIRSYFKKRPKRVSGATRAYRIDVLRRFPELLPECPSEDASSLLRCLIVAPGRIISDALVKHRAHFGNASGLANIKIMREKWPMLKLQARCDLNFGLAHDLISKNVYNQSLRWLERSFKVRDLRASLILESPKFFLLQRALFTRAISFREAAGYLRLLAREWLPFGADASSKDTEI